MKCDKKRERQEELRLKELPRQKTEEEGTEVVNWLIEEETKREVLGGKREVIDWVV